MATELFRGRVLLDRYDIWWPVVQVVHQSNILDSTYLSANSTVKLMSLLQLNRDILVDTSNTDKFKPLPSKLEGPFSDPDKKELAKMKKDLSHFLLFGERCYNIDEFYAAAKDEEDAAIQKLHCDSNETKKRKGAPSATPLSSCSIPAKRVTKREGAIQWDDYFMAIAFLSAKRSKDPSTQVGACIVNADRRIVGIGYNGFPRGCSDEVLPWARDGDFLDTKYAYVCHAEVNAILNKNSSDVSGCTIYVALFPCNECAKMIIQSGIKEVAFLDDKYHDTPAMTASRRMLDMAGVKQRKVRPEMTCVEINLS